MSSGILWAGYSTEFSAPEFLGRTVASSSYTLRQLFLRFTPSATLASSVETAFLRARAELPISMAF